VVIRKVNYEYICPVCKRSYTKRSDAQKCELKGDGKLDIVPGEVFGRVIIDQDDVPRLYNVLFVRDVSNCMPCKDRVTHFPYWRIVTLRRDVYVNIKKSFRVRPYVEINPDNFHQLPREFYEDSEAIFTKRRSETGLEKGVIITRGLEDHLYSNISRWRRRLNVALKVEDYRAARSIQRIIQDLLKQNNNS
jgi:hypothetical protein